LCFGTPIPSSAVTGALLGCGGVVLVFWPQIADMSASGASGRGIVTEVLSALIASAGNIVTSRNQRAGQPVVPNTAWSMMYGAAFVAGYALLGGESLRIEWSVGYVLSLLYLAVFGSVVAFTAYLTLMQRIGPGKAGYSSVAVPVVALLLSTLFESLRWQPVMVAGAVLCLAGNLLVLRGGRRSLLRWLRGNPIRE
jgi:drug/metabolite transporter (DMT)-like permease